MQMSSHVVYFLIEMFSVFVCGSGLELLSLCLYECVSSGCVVMSHCVILFAPPLESSTYSDFASHPAPSSSSPSRKPWETKPACQSRAAWGKTGVSWRQTALRPCTLAPPTDMAPPSPWCPPTSHRNQKLTSCLNPSHPKFRNTPACASEGFGPEKNNNSALGRK